MVHQYTENDPQQKPHSMGLFPTYAQALGEPRSISYEFDLSCGLTLRVIEAEFVTRVGFCQPVCKIRQIVTLCSSGREFTGRQAEAIFLNFFPAQAFKYVQNFFEQQGKKIVLRSADDHIPIMWWECEDYIS